MKKIILILIICVYFVGCSNLKKGVQDNKKWTSARELIFHIDKLKIGDVIVKDKRALSPLTWFGHVAVMSSLTHVTEYPMIGAGFIKCDIFSWLNEERKVAVMRYKYFDEDFKEGFLNTIKRNRNKTYRLFTGKMNKDYFYCSSYVWQMYYKTAKNLNDPNFDYDYGKENMFIYPYDFLGLPNFENVTSLILQN